MSALLWFSFGQYWALNHKVTFDGPNKLIYINDGVTEINVRVDLYSDWKEWVMYEENAKYEQAMRTVGGDPISPGVFLGQTFFLVNGWRIRTWEGTHRLVVNGNIYTEEGDNIFVPTLQPWTIEVALTRSNLVDLIAPIVNVDGIEIPTAIEIAEAVWDQPTASHTINGTFGRTAFETYSQTVTNGLSIGNVASQVWERPLTSHTTVGTFGKRVQDLPLSIPTAPTVTQIKDAVWNAALVDHVANGTFGKRVQDIPDATTVANSVWSDTDAATTISSNVPTSIDIANAVWNDVDAATTISNNVPSAADNANAVWNDPDALTVISGATASPAAIADAVWDEAFAAHNIVGTFGYLTQEMASDANNAHLVALQAVSILEVLIKYEKNRTKIDKTAFTLTVYDDDGVTPIRVFNLRNSLGAPSVTEVTERVPQ